jgi:hypothetical protein
MPFQKGQSGNPTGRPKEQAWRDALRIAVKEAMADGTPKLRALADKTVALALDGDMHAIKEIGDRLDGKPAQAITSEDGGAFTINIMRFTGDAS